MQRVLTVASWATAALVLSLAGCGGGGGESAPEGELAPNVVQPGAPGEPSRTVSADELAELEPPGHTDADVRFMQGMIHHHAQALRMAVLAPKNGAGRDVQLLAMRIELSQEGEIELMQAWLRERDEEAPELHPVHGHAHGPGGEELMPGMLTNRQLRELQRARGRGFDRLFLRRMIVHHEGALEMVRELYGAGGGLESAADAFARHVESDQQVEILRMQQLLAAR